MKHLSAIAIPLALIFFLINLWMALISCFEFQNTIKYISEQAGDISPKIYAGGIKASIFNSIPIILALILAIIGFVKKNKYRVAALIITILALIIPIAVLPICYWNLL